MAVNQDSSSPSAGSTAGVSRASVTVSAPSLATLVDVGHAAERDQVLRRREQHDLELRLGFIVLSEIEERTSERDACG